MLYTQEEAIEKLSQVALANTKDRRKKNRQRRNQVTELYGIPYIAVGDNGAPASVHIPVSPSMIYYERFSFKIQIKPFTSTVQGGTGAATVDVNDTSLSVSGSSITPNPHDHSTSPHSHNLISGVSISHTTASDFRVYLEGIDITPYLMAQYGTWISGEGIYPSDTIERDYDILEVISDLKAEGRDAEADRLARAGWKPLEITSSSPFAAEIDLWLRYSNANK